MGGNQKTQATQTTSMMGTGNEMDPRLQCLMFAVLHPQGDYIIPCEMENYEEFLQKVNSLEKFQEFIDRYHAEMSCGDGPKLLSGYKHGQLPYPDQAVGVAIVAAHLINVYPQLSRGLLRLSADFTKKMDEKDEKVFYEMCEEDNDAEQKSVNM